jgi:hypothetical protein
MAGRAELPGSVASPESSTIIQIIEFDHELRIGLQLDKFHPMRQKAATVSHF